MVGLGAWGVTGGQEQGGLESREGIRVPWGFGGWGLEALRGWGLEALRGCGLAALGGWSLEGLEPKRGWDRWTYQQTFRRKFFPVLWYIVPFGSAA